MNEWIAVDLAGARQEDSCATSFCHAEHVDRTHDRRFDRFDGVELIVSGRGWAGHVIDLVDFEEDRQGYVVPDQFKIWSAQKVSDILLLSGKEIVEANHIVPVIDQAFAHMGTEESGAASYEYALEFCHGAGYLLSGTIGNRVSFACDRSDAISAFPGLKIDNCGTGANNRTGLGVELKRSALSDLSERG